MFASLEILHVFDPNGRDMGSIIFRKCTSFESPCVQFGREDYVQDQRLGTLQVPNQL